MQPGQYPTPSSLSRCSTTPPTSRPGGIFCTIWESPGNRTAPFPRHDPCSVRPSRWMQTSVRHISPSATCTPPPYRTVARSSGKTGPFTGWRWIIISRPGQRTRVYQRRRIRKSPPTGAVFRIRKHSFSKTGSQGSPTGWITAVTHGSTKRRQCALRNASHSALLPPPLSHLAARACGPFVVYSCQHYADRAHHRSADS